VPDIQIKEREKPTPAPNRDNRLTEKLGLQLHCDYLEWRFACTLWQMGEGVHVLYSTGVRVYVLNPAIWVCELGVDVRKEHCN